MPVGCPDDGADRDDRSALDRPVDMRIGRARDVVPPRDPERIEVHGQGHERSRVGQEVPVEGGAQCADAIRAVDEALVAQRGGLVRARRVSLVPDVFRGEMERVVGQLGG